MLIDVLRRNYFKTVKVNIIENFHPFLLLTGANFDESIMLNENGIQGEVTMDDSKLV